MSGPTPRRPHYPVVIDSPRVLALPRPRAVVPGFPVLNPAVLLSSTRLGIATRGSGSCPWVPDELTVLSPHTITIHLSMGTYRNGKLVTRPLPNGCTLDLTTTRMLLAIDPTQIDIHRPLSLRLFYGPSTQPELRTVLPLKS